MRALLDDRAVIALGGPDARTLLQGLITNDIERLDARPRVLCRAADPAGQDPVRLHPVAEGDGAVLLDCAADTADALVKRLTLYRLRAKVEIERRDQLVGDWRPGTARPCPPASRIPRLAALGTRTIAGRGGMPAADLGRPTAYHAHRLDLGVPEGRRFRPGSDVRARCRSRGTPRRRFREGLLCRPGADGAHEASRHGTQAPAAGRDGRWRRPARSPERRSLPAARRIGEIVSTHGARGFALIRLDRLDEAGGASLDRRRTARHPFQTGAGFFLDATGAWARLRDGPMRGVAP